MTTKRDPFNIFLLSNQKSRLLGLLPVQSMDIFNLSGEFHPQGLYSVEVFGPLGSPERQKKHGYIDMHAQIMHPKDYIELSRLKGLYGNLMSGKAYATWDNAIKDFVKADAIDGKTGYSFFMEHFEEIVFQQNDSSIRDLRIDFITKTQKICMYRYLVVIPAGLRDIDYDENGSVVEDDINGFYRKVLRIRNTIIVNPNNLNDPALDMARWSLQKAFNDIYLYIESILQGKRGFLLSKVAARSVHGGTRNVITAIDPAPGILGDPDTHTVNDTLIGLHQYLKGTVELSIYGIRTGPMKYIVEGIPAAIPVVDPGTLCRVIIQPNEYIIAKWGSAKGIEDSMNKFEKTNARHLPVTINGYFAALLYRDDKYFRVLYDIRELPEGYDKSKVAPITWAEMFYISVYLQSKNVAAVVTRYPIVELGSITPTFVYLQTTVKQQTLQRLDDNWKPVTNEPKAAVMPVTGQPFYDSMSIHSSRVEEFNADYDGDSGTYL